jgi:hypothetical protein
MLGHISFGLSNLDRTIAFYEAVLEPLALCGFGHDRLSPGVGCRSTQKGRAQ